MRKIVPILISTSSMISMLSGTAMSAPLNELGLRLGESQINSQIVGKSFMGHYLFDGISFRETYKRDGTLDYRDEREAMTGVWTIEEGLFCNRYDEPVGGCFALYRTSSNCFSSFSAPQRDPKVPSQLQSVEPFSPFVGEVPSVQMWDESKPSTCSGQEPVS